MEAFKEHFKEEDIVYVLYGLIFADGDYSVVKRVLVTWVGQKVRFL